MWRTAVSQRQTSVALPETWVDQRYQSAARTTEPALCCPVSYDARYLEVIPPEILEKDYGCGDPTSFVERGETVLDLGSGAGKLCYILAQVVGPQGKVIGVDRNSEMLALARKYQDQVARQLGYANVTFRCGIIQDLKLDLERLAQATAGLTLNGPEDWLELRRREEQLRNEEPMIPDASVDCIVSNCVLNLVRPQDRDQLFAEMLRVLRPGGRVAISDIVSDEDVPDHIRSDPELWSGCIAGVYREDEFLEAFRKAGFVGVTLARYTEKPWRVIEGIEFRSVTVVAYKPEGGPCLDCNQAVIYKGPFQQVSDDEGHRYPRGKRVAVCEKTFRMLQRSPYRDHFVFIEPRQPVDPAGAPPFPCHRPTIRHPRETKGERYCETSDCKGTGCC